MATPRALAAADLVQRLYLSFSGNCHPGSEPKPVPTTNFFQPHWAKQEAAVALPVRNLS